MKLKKRIHLIDQASKLGFWGGKFGGNEGNHGMAGPR